MKFIKKVSTAIHSRAGSYIFFLLSVFAFINLKSAVWAYEWIAQMYPLGSNFVPTMLIIIAVTAVIHFAYLLFSAIKSNGKSEAKSNKFINIIHTIFAILAIITFLYTAVLVFGIDAGFVLSRILNGFEAIIPNLIYPALAGGFGLLLVFCNGRKSAVKAFTSGVVISAIIIGCTIIPSVNFAGSGNKNMPEITMQSVNLVDGASIVFESLRKGEKADAVNMLNDDNKCWTAQSPNRMPADGCSDSNNSYAEIQLAEKSEINTAVIE